MAITTAIVTGVVVGLQHSLETDHLAAISTLVSEEKTDRPAVVGASWGVGHSIPILAVGLVFVFLSASLPSPVTTLFEALAGLILVYLGVRMVLSVLSVDQHTHGGNGHTHISFGRFSVGSSHTHVDEESFVVGIVHGLAGSGAVVVALATSAATVPSSVSLLVSFSVITILTMGVLSFLWGTVLTTPIQSALRLGAGSASVVIGVGLAASVLFGVDLITV